MIGVQRAVWQQQHVVDVRDAAFAARTYLEHRDVRALIDRALGGRRVPVGCEVGAGYGRMTVLLTEYADRVIGIEREPHFVQEAARLLPAVHFVNVGGLAPLPLKTAAVDLFLTFTVLQHLTDAVAEATIREMLRALRPGGVVLICEETDPRHRDGAVDDPAGMCTIGRPVEIYRRLFDPMVLLDSRPRRIEPTYPRADVGTYLLLQKPI